MKIRDIFKVRTWKLKLAESAINSYFSELTGEPYKGPVSIPLSRISEALGFNIDTLFTKEEINYNVDEENPKAVLNKDIKYPSLTLRINPDDVDHFHVRISRHNLKTKKKNIDKNPQPVRERETLSVATLNYPLKNGKIAPIASIIHGEIKEKTLSVQFVMNSGHSYSPTEKNVNWALDIIADAARKASLFRSRYQKNYTLSRKDFVWTQETKQPELRHQEKLAM